MNGDLNQKLTEFFQAKMPGCVINAEGTTWLYTTFKKTKAQQKTEFVDWLNARKTSNTALINGEPTASAAKVSALQADNAICDTIIASF